VLAGICFQAAAIAGRLLPGTLLGAVLIQTVESGLSVTNADPRSDPVVVGAVIWLALALERWRGE
jgi:ribose/xylose/arabinose/galactoside ABC-type transport system permease subunit